MKYALLTFLMLSSVVSQAETLACIVQFGSNKVTRLVQENEPIQDVDGIQVLAKTSQACSMECGSSLNLQISIGETLQFSHEAYAREGNMPGAYVQGNYQGKSFLVHCAKPQ